MNIAALHHTRSRWQQLSLRAADLGVSALYLLMPFHAVLVIGLAGAVGHREYVALWKEMVIILLLLATGFVAFSRHRLRSYLSPDSWLIIAMLVCGLVANLLAARFGLDFWVGVKTTAFPLLLFLAVQVVASRFSDKRLAWLLLAPAAIVAGLALWQFFVIPTSLLTRLGYSADTIMPYQPVHPGFPFARSFATLGGPNQLGTYLILPGSLALACAVMLRDRRARIGAAIVFVLCLLACITTFSRSALLGYAVSSAVVIVLAVPKRWRWLAVMGLSMAAAVAAFSTWYVLTTNSMSEAGRYLVRGDLNSSGIVGGDAGHINALVKGYETIRTHPLGLGFGTAGPASQYGANPLITENWFLQIGVELGLIGLMLMLVFLVHVAVEAVRRKPHSPVHLSVAATIAGVAIACLFLHSLADSTLAILLFATAGIVTARRRHV